MARIARTVLLPLLLLSAAVFPLGASTIRMVGLEDNTGAWTEIIARFESAHPGVNVEYIPGPSSTDERQNMYIRSFLGGDPFEIVMMDVVWTAKFAENGWIEPLDNDFSAEELDAFVPSTLEAGRYRGSLYRIPLRGDVGMLYYRKDLVQMPPKTWKELEQICEASPAGKECILFQGMQYEGLTCDFLEYLWGAGGEVIGKDGKVHIGSEPAVEALGFMRSLIDKGYAPRSVLTYQEHHSLSGFMQKKALFMRNWPYAWRVLNAEDSPLRGKVGIVPFVYKEGHASAGTLGGWGFGVASGAKHKEDVLAFIRSATSEEAQKLLVKRRGIVPSRTSLFSDPEVLENNPQFPKVYEALLLSRARPVHPDYPRISDTIQKQVSAVLSGVRTPREAARIMQASIEGTVSGTQKGIWGRLASDFDLRQTLYNTVLFTLASVPVEFALGLLIALLINLPFRGRSLGRIAVLIPWALPTAVMAMSWQWMFSNPFGVINDLLMRAGLLDAPVDWLALPSGAMAAAVFADVWKTTPFVVIILLAGLQSVPNELKESVSLDTPSPLKRFFVLTLPMLLPFIRVALIFRVIQAAGIFDLLWVLTHGGPADSTRVLAMYIYDLAFRYGQMGYAFFLTLLFVAALILLSVLIVRATTLRYERAVR
jgi:multiple sugar transport system substrate-binding protein